MALATQDSFATNDGATLLLADVEVDFNVLNVSPSRKVRCSYSNRHVPWGNQNVIQLGGKLPPEPNWTLYVPSEDAVDTLLEAVGRQGTLTCYEYPDGVQAALVEADASDYLIDDQRQVKVVFLVSDPNS
jgi:hypothetical protein